MFEWGRAICYSGYRENQSPRTKTYPTKTQIEEDMAILAKEGFRYLRMYEPVSYVDMTCEVIRENGYDMKMMLGPELISEINNPGCPWLQTNYSDEELKERAEFNDRRIDAVIDIANRNKDIIHVVSVGNENTPSWTANYVPQERLIEFAKRLKKETNLPITFNEGAFEWPALTELAKYLDIISVHSYPLWNGKTVEEALQVNKEWYQKICELYPDKMVLFSEVGWATKCVNFTNMKEGQANEENQVKYYKEFWDWTDREKIIAYMFEAFDEAWKGGNNPDESEKNWGIYYIDRTPKPVMQKK